MWDGVLRSPHVRRFKTHAALVTTLVFLTALSGAFVAGLYEGFVYNEFPLMCGCIAPSMDELFAHGAPARCRCNGVPTGEFSLRGGNKSQGCRVIRPSVHSFLRVFISSDMCHKINPLPLMPLHPYNTQPLTNTFLTN